MIRDAADEWGFTADELSTERTGEPTILGMRQHHHATSRVYVLHFDPPFRHARHYIGIAHDGNVLRRLHEHLRGRGSGLVLAAYVSGCRVTVTVDMPGDLGLERRLHNRHGTRVCPVCVPRLRHLI